MNILLDLRCVHPGMTGIGRYALNLCHSLERTARGVRVEALATERALEFLRPRVQVPLIPVPSVEGWDHLGLPALLRERKTTVYHSPLFVLPSVAVCDYVCTVHDVIPLARPEMSHAAFTNFFMAAAPAGVRRARIVLTVSEHSRNDIVDHLGVDPNRVAAIHETVSPCFGPRPEAVVLREMATFGLRPGFILFVGAIDRRKNLPRLLQAFGQLPESPPLVIVGGPSGDGYQIERDIAALGIERRVRVLGRVSDETLACLYCAASVFVFPSLYEGFGLPVVEAMASGTPVVTSRTTSLGEIAKDAAYLVDPEDAAQIRNALAQMIASPAMRREYAMKGLMRAAEFSIERQGERILDVYRSISARAA